MNKKTNGKILKIDRNRKLEILCRIDTYTTPNLVHFLTILKVFSFSNVVSEWCKPFIPSRHIHSIIKHLVYYTTLGIVKINIFEHFKKYLNSTNIFLETDNNFTQ